MGQFELSPENRVSRERFLLLSAAALIGIEGVLSSCNSPCTSGPNGTCPGQLPPGITVTSGETRTPVTTPTPEKQPLPIEPLFTANIDRIIPLTLNMIKLKASNIGELVAIKKNGNWVYEEPIVNQFTISALNPTPGMPDLVGTVFEYTKRPPPDVEPVNTTLDTPVITALTFALKEAKLFNETKPLFDATFMIRTAVVNGIAAPGRAIAFCDNANVKPTAASFLRRVTRLQV